MAYKRHCLYWVTLTGACAKPLLHDDAGAVACTTVAVVDGATTCMVAADRCAESALALAFGAGCCLGHYSHHLTFLVFWVELNFDTSTQYFKLTVEQKDWVEGF